MKRILLGLALLAASNANASLISADSSYGVGTLTQDTATGLEWLDLTLSTNLSYNQVQGGANGYLANGFVVATLAQVELLLTHAGWDGIDASATSGSAANLAATQSLIALLGQVGVSGSPGETAFTEGFALNGGVLARQFSTISQNGVAGRIACTTAGFNAFANTDTSGCRGTFDQHQDFTGIYLVRRTAAPNVPEPVTLGLLGLGLVGIGFVRRKRAV
jgi:hypothetical protein